MLKKESFQKIKNKIKFWTLLNCLCKLCKAYEANVDYIKVSSFMRFQFS